MTDPAPRQERAAERAKDRRGRRLLATFAGLFALGLVLLTAATLSSRTEIAQLTDRADSGEDAARQLAAQVYSLGGVPSVPVPALATGQPGQNGNDGVGIASVQPGDCALTVRLTDGRATTLADLCGTPGQDGQPARSIVGTTATGCLITLAFSDGSTVQLGPFCGPAGERGEAGEPGAKGEKGDKGDLGQPGRGAAGLQLDLDTCTGTQFYDDGTSAPVTITGCDTEPEPPASTGPPEPTSSDDPPPLLPLPTS